MLQRKRTDSHNRFLAQELVRDICFTKKTFSELTQSPSPHRNSSLSNHQTQPKTYTNLSTSSKRSAESKKSVSGTQQSETTNINNTHFRQTTESISEKSTSLSHRLVEATSSTCCTDSFSMHITIRGRGSRRTQSIDGMQRALTNKVTELLGCQRKESSLSSGDTENSHVSIYWYKHLHALC